MQHVEKILNAFLEGESKVLVIKGSWGVGKTYFWEKYIADRIEKKDLNQVAYSYISLFGASSLEEMRKQVFHKTKLVSDDNRLDDSFEKESIEAGSFLSKVPWVKGALAKVQKKAPLISQASKCLQYIPGIGKFSGMLESMEYALVKNYIICIDDIERKGSALSITDVMGLVDELAQRKACKVILIFNEDELGNTDKSQFEKYREKIVDKEIHYNPTSKENLAYIFDAETFSRYAVLEDTVCKLDIKNIRILRNLKIICDAFNEFINVKDDKIIDEFIIHATLFSKFYYNPDKDLTYDIFRIYIPEDELAQAILYNDNNNEETVWRAKYNKLMKKIDFIRSLFDDHIDFFLKNGYLERPDELKKSVTKIEEDIHVNSIKSKIERAWAIYGDSFKDNYDEFKASMIDILDNEMGRLELGTCSSILDILERLGENIDTYVEKYAKLNKEKFSTNEAKNDNYFGRCNCKKLIDKIEELNQLNKAFDINETLSNFVRTNVCSREDKEYLESLSVADYQEWMKSHTSNMSFIISRGLLKFGGEIAKNTTAALKLIAAEPSKNNFNKFRIENMYKIKLDDSDT